MVRTSGISHDDVIKWKHFPRYWPFVRGIHRPPVNSLLTEPVTRSFDVFFDLIIDWVNNRDAGDFRGHDAHCDVIVMTLKSGINDPTTHHCNDLGVTSPHPCDALCSCLVKPVINITFLRCAPGWPNKHVIWQNRPVFGTYIYMHIWKIHKNTPLSPMKAIFMEIQLNVDKETNPRGWYGMVFH